MNKSMILPFLILIIVTVGCNYIMNDTYDKGISDSGTVYTITGKFIDTNANPIVNMTIKLSGKLDATAITDTSGNYVFNNVPPGSYTVTPGDTGHSPKSISVINKDIILETNNDGHGGNINGNYTCSGCHNN